MGLWSQASRDSTELYVEPILKFFHHHDLVKCDSLLAWLTSTADIYDVSGLYVFTLFSNPPNSTNFKSKMTFFCLSQFEKRVVTVLADRNFN